MYVITSASQISFNLLTNNMKIDIPTQTTPLSIESIDVY